MGRAIKSWTYDSFKKTLLTYVMYNSEALQKKIAWDYKHKLKGQKYFAKAL